MVNAETGAGPALRYASARGRWVLAATVLGSGIAMLDSTVVGIALPTIGREFGADLPTLQWVVTSYTLTLAGLLLLGGALGDRYGRRRVFLVGVVWFGAASLVCALAWNAPVLVLARALQGVGGALLTPGSLAILQSSFTPDDRSKAIGAWSGLVAIAAAVGPFLGGWVIDAVSWRLIFLLNVPLVVAVVLIGVRHVPESRAVEAAGPLDVRGAVLGSLGLTGVTYGLIAGSDGWTSWRVIGALAAGIGLLAAFVAAERRAAEPMLPLPIFRSRQFTAANLMTFAIYGALGGALFLLPIALQSVARYSPLASGAALLPITLLMLTLSARSGSIAARIGPRIQMSAGPIVVGVGMALLARLTLSGFYLTEVLPAVTVIGLGLVVTVAPLTTTVLAAVPEGHAGVASAVNNDVARAAGLIAVAVLPAAAGLSGTAYRNPAVFLAGFRTAVLIAAVACVAAGLLGIATIRNAPKASRGPAERQLRTCPLDGPPLRAAAR